MSAIPRPLLIVVIVLLVLGVASCALGLAGGRDRGDSNQQKTELSGDAFTSFLKTIMPAPPSVASATLIPAACAPIQSSSSTLVTAGNPCTVIIGPTDDLRRRLRLTVSSGVVTIDITQDVSGNQQTSAPTVPQNGEDTIEVVVGRRAGASMLIRCLVASCTLSQP